jgi:hypothetical protein
MEVSRFHGCSFFFSSQFQSSILDMLEMELRNFFIYFFFKLFWSHDLIHEFNKLT